MSAYYNEHNPYAAAWLRNLIEAGLIADGVVDERSILDVKPEELRQYRQVHLFAGIGGWSLALRLAGWPDEKPVWTGSCLYQPFSGTGKRGGFADERHLWPAFHWLISQLLPPVVFGEQVASSDGRYWLDLVSTDLEGTGYAVAPFDLAAAGVGTPHIRQRLYFVAERVGDALRKRLEGYAGDVAYQRESGRVEAPTLGPVAEAGSLLDREAVNGVWRFSDWIEDGAGNWRPIQPGIEPMADGFPGRVERIRAYGNAIVPQVAQAVIEAYLDSSD